MLHVHNVCILGGVPTFVADFAAAFPQFTHIALHVRDQADRDAIQMLHSEGIRVFFGPLTEGVVESFSPAIVVLHNISGAHVDGPAPWSWLQRWPTVFWHHSQVSPLVKADLHVFVSDYLKGCYQGMIDKKIISRWKVIPPCIRTAKYKGVNRSSNRTIGKLATPTRPEKYPFVLLSVAQKTGCKLVMPGANRYYPDDNGQLMSLVPSWHKVPAFLSMMQVFVYVNAPSFGPETWCRGVTEALAAGLPVVAENRGGIREQIQDGKTGFLVAPDDEYMIRARVEELLDKPDLAKSIGEAGRKWAQTHADISVLQRELQSEFLNMLLDNPR